MVYENKKGESIRVCFPDKKGKFVIPEFLGDYQCKIIEAEKFIYSKVTEVIIPESVVDIEDCAFEGCISLTKINIPKNITSIKSHTFFDCKNLRSVEIPKEVTSIGESAFGGCHKLSRIDISESVTRIGRFAFEYCYSLDIVINNSEFDVRVGERAFNECNSVKWLK